MESSTVLAFRIFVMLSCLIIVPMAAIFGSAFPDVVKTVLVDRLVAWSTGKPVDAPNTAASPDGFREVAPGSPNTAVADQSKPEAPRWGGPEAEGWHAQGGSGVVPASGVAANGANQAGFAAPADGRTVYPPVHRVPAGRNDPPYPAGGQQRGLSGAPEANPSAPPGQIVHPHAGGDRFAELERKLREAGATYYLLETFGSDGRSYRFHCRMPLGNDPNQTRPFEATGPDPLAAMSHVVEQVEAWRAGQ